MNIQDKVALITGSGRGMGRAIALGLAKNGAKIALTGRNQDLLDKVAKEIEDIGGNSKTFLFSKLIFSILKFLSFFCINFC